jgi:hypothetical protein
MYITDSETSIFLFSPKPEHEDYTCMHNGYHALFSCLLALRWTKLPTFHYLPDHVVCREGCLQTLWKRICLSNLSPEPSEPADLQLLEAV